MTSPSCSTLGARDTAKRTLRKKRDNTGFKSLETITTSSHDTTASLTLLTLSHSMPSRIWLTTSSRPLVLDSLLLQLRCWCLRDRVLRTFGEKFQILLIGGRKELLLMSKIKEAAVFWFYLSAHQIWFDRSFWVQWVSVWFKDQDFRIREVTEKLKSRIFENCGQGCLIHLCYMKTNHYDIVWDCNASLSRFLTFRSIISFFYFSFHNYK